MRSCLAWCRLSVAKRRANPDTASEMPRLRLPWTFDGNRTELDAGYAYLLHSAVRMSELYPLLGELLFASQVVSTNGEDQGPANLIGMFVEDKQEFLFRHLVEEIPAKRGITAGFRSWLSANGSRTPVAAWFHTFGEFSEYTGSLSCLDGASEPSGGSVAPWWTMEAVGAGNPMTILRFIRLVHAENPQVPVAATLNLYLLCSLSNLYRNLGLAETAAFLKMVLEESVWKGQADAGDGTLGGKPGLFFAVLQEGVMDEREASYLESFFDGIFRIEPWTDPKVQHGSGIRLASVLTEVLPLQETLPPPFVYRPRGSGSPDHPSLKSLAWRASRFISMVQRPRTKRWWRRCGQYLTECLR